MITLAWYLLKIIICSGILCGYYYLVLRNKIFHRWNRFYLLAAVVLSLIVPVMKINIFQSSGQDKGTVVKMLQTINNSDEIIIEYSRHSGLQLNSENIISAIYFLITTAFLSIFFLALYKIFRLKKNYPVTKLKGISFISTDAKGTPFSFFNSIFWNNAVDLHSRQGQQIFNHEIAHVKEKHSYDKIFMNIVLIFFWLNPFFWLMRKELSMIHEFIADNEALEDSDINAFAEMILQTVYPGQQFSITNNFFHSPLKRRLIMFTKNKNPKVSYVSRLLVLPLAAIVFFAFTLKVNPLKTSGGYSGKTITVVIDAGHGGDDNGAISTDGLKEKDINLAIAKKIAGLNSNDHIKILLSRKDDISMNVKDRVEFAKANHSDLFISIHTNAADKDKSNENGFSVIIDKNNSEKNKLLASSIINELKKIYTTESAIGVRTKGVWVLDNNSCPSALIECGYLTSPADEAFITVSSNQEKIARYILHGIEKYAEQNSVSAPMAQAESDSIPTMYYKGKKVTGLTVPSESKNIKVAKPVIKVTYEDGSTEMISKQESDKRGFILPPPPPLLPRNKSTNTDFLNQSSNPTYYVDGKMISKKDFDAIDPSSIGSITILKGDKATKIYGDPGQNGVVLVTKKKNEVITTDNQNSSKPDPIYFLDGKEISKDKMNTLTLSPNAIQSISVLKGESAIAVYGQKAKNGVIIITSKPEGLNTSVTIGTNTNTDANSIHLTNQNDKSGKMSNNIDFNGHPNINNTTDTIPDKVFTKVEHEAEFPGGKEAWVRYMVKNIQASIDPFTEKDYGTCVLKFIVNTDGSVSNVEATTMQDTHLAEIAMNAIRTGPKWIPATQNDHTVAAYRLQPVTLTNPDKK